MTMGIPMRFEVGSQVPFIHVKFEHGTFSNADGVSFMTYFPWEHKLLGIDILMLTCNAHHKVPKEVGEETTEDGFIFTDNDQNIWHNQFPIANGLNELAERDIESETHLEAEMARGIVNFEMKALSTYLAAVARGVFDILAQGEKDGMAPIYKDNAALLQAHYDEVVLKFETMTGQKVVRTERTFGKGAFRGTYLVSFELPEALSSANA